MVGGQLKLITTEFYLAPLEQVSTHIPLREIVYLKLKGAILEGSLKPGQLISENQISQKLSVSRTPVREAIRILETENLVTFLPGKKVIVTIPTVEDIHEVYEIRLMIEKEALRKVNPTHIQRMEEFVKLGEKYREEENLQKRVEMNTNFHLEIISALENKRIKRYLDSLHETISRFRVYYLILESGAKPEIEHREIITSIKDGEMEEAISILNRHLTNSKENLIKVFTQEYC